VTKLAVAVRVFQNTQNLLISRYCLIEDGYEMFLYLNCTYRTIVLIVILLFNDVLVCVAVMISLYQGPVHTPPEEFENAGLTLKTHQMSFVHSTSEDFKNAAITGDF